MDLFVSYASIFVIGGILMYRKETRREFGDFVRSNIIRRLRTTAVPYYVFGSMLAVFYTLLNIIGDEPISFFEKMFNLLALKGIDSLWFFTYIHFSGNHYGIDWKPENIWKEIAFYHDIMQFFNSDIFIRLYEHLVFGYTL